MQMMTAFERASALIGNGGKELTEDMREDMRVEIRRLSDGRSSSLTPHRSGWRRHGTWRKG